MNETNQISRKNNWDHQRLFLEESEMTEDSFILGEAETLVHKRQKICVKPVKSEIKKSNE